MIPKFRVFDKQKKQMVESAWWEFYFEDERLLTVTSDLDVSYYDDELGERWELMQSTGLHDMHEEEVYQGDIIYDDCDNEYGVVVFGEAKFVIEWQSNHVEDLFERIDLLEVVSNIHEHSDLLE